MMSWMPPLMLHSTLLYDKSGIQSILSAEEHKLQDRKLAGKEKQVSVAILQPLEFKLYYFTLVCIFVI